MDRTGTAPSRPTADTPACKSIPFVQRKPFYFFNICLLPSPWACVSLPFRVWQDILTPLDSQLIFQPFWQFKLVRITMWKSIRATQIQLHFTNPQRITYSLSLMLHSTEHLSTLLYYYLILWQMLKLTKSREPPEVPGSLPPGAEVVCSAAPQVLLPDLLLVITYQSSTSDGRSPGLRQEPRDEEQKLSRNGEMISSKKKRLILSDCDCLILVSLQRKININITWLQLLIVQNI